MALHEQPFELFDLKARFAGSMVGFDPRRAFARQIFCRHGALHGTGHPNAALTTSPSFRTRVNCFT
jgi:hypothetical protein